MGGGGPLASLLTAQLVFKTVWLPGDLGMKFVLPSDFSIGPCFPVHLSGFHPFRKGFLLALMWLLL